MLVRAIAVTRFAGDEHDLLFIGICGGSLFRIVLSLCAFLRIEILDPDVAELNQHGRSCVQLQSDDPCVSPLLLIQIGTVRCCYAIDLMYEVKPIGQH